MAILLLKYPHIHIHLPNILMIKLTYLEVDEDEAFEQVVVEHEINKKFFAFNPQMLLPGDEGKALTKFHEEFLQLIEQALLKVLFIQPGIRSCA